MEGKEAVIAEISRNITFVKELQADSQEELLWHSYMKRIDELEQQLDLLTRG